MSSRGAAVRLFAAGVCVVLVVALSVGGPTSRNLSSVGAVGAAIGAAAGRIGAEEVSPIGPIFGSCLLETAQVAGPRPCLLTLR
jgi:hypothetical protein